MIQKALSLAEWQRVEDGRNKAMRNVERRVAIVASPAPRVLSHEVVPRTTDGASVIQGFGPRVAEQGCQIGSETLADLGAETVVVSHAVVLQELYSSGAESLLTSRNISG